VGSGHYNERKMGAVGCFKGRMRNKKTFFIFLLSKKEPFNYMFLKNMYYICNGNIRKGH